MFTLGVVGTWLAGGSVVAWTGHLGLMDSLLLLCGDDRPGFKDQKATGKHLLPPSLSGALGPELVCLENPLFSFWRLGL